MAPTNPQTKHNKPQTTNVGEEVLDLVIPYIHNVDDRSSLSLVSRKFYEIDGITRKRLTVHVLYYPNPASFSKRFPFIESLTLKGPPFRFIQRYHYHRIKITPWIQQLAHEFRCLKELNIRCMAVSDKDLETLARTRGKDLRTLKIKKCEGIWTDGLMHVSNYCNRLTSLYLKCSDDTNLKYGIWLHQLALNSTVLERLHVTNTYEDDMYMYDAEDLALLAKNCSNSLISLKIGGCHLSKLGDAFRYAVRLEHFGGYIWDDESELVNFGLPPNMCSLSMGNLEVTQVLPFRNHIRKLNLEYVNSDYLVLKACPNLEVLYINGAGDYKLQVIGEFCKNLRKITSHNGFATHKGLIALAKGCAKLESLKIINRDISNEAIKCLGTHLKNLRKFRMKLFKYNEAIEPLDNGIRAMLTGCRKLERLDLDFRWQEGLTDLGLEYIGEFGANLRSLSLTLSGNSNVGLVKLSKGCPRLRKLNLGWCPFSEQAVASCVFNMPSLRYVWLHRGDHTILALTRPGFQLGNIGVSTCAS